MTKPPFEELDAKSERKIDDSLISDLGLAILRLQHVLVERNLPELKSLDVHPEVKRELYFQARGMNPYVDLSHDKEGKMKMSLCGVQILDRK